MNECEKVNKGIDKVYRILKNAHQVVKADMEAKPILSALSSYEREKSIMATSKNR